MKEEEPVIGALVTVRGERWVVSEIETGNAGTLVGLQSVEDGRYGDRLDVVWEIEPGRRVLPSGSLPDVTPEGFDPPERLAAFLDAIRWSAVASADVKTLQAPFRSGVAVEDYQLEPVARALDAPRVNLLLADDVGLGKTIEAGLVAQELLLRHRARRVMIVCPAGLTLKWRDEMAEKFGLDFTIVDTERCAIVRRTYGSAANPFEVHPLTIVSLPWLRGPKAQRLLDEVLDSSGLERRFDLLILDEAHHVAPAAPKQVYAVDSQQTKLIRRLAPHFTHRLFLSATPHNGYQASFTALLEILDDQRFARGVEPDPSAVGEAVVRRLKRHIVNADGTKRFLERAAHAMPVRYPDDEREIHDLLKEFARLRRARLNRSRKGRKAADLVTLLLKKRLFSSPAAFAHTVGVYLSTVTSTSTSTATGTSASAASATQAAAPDDDEIPEWMEDYWEQTAVLDDEPLAAAEDDALGMAAPLQGAATEAEITLLRRMRGWALDYAAAPDAKARELITYLKAVCRPGGHWTNERVVVFTEYRDTQKWLTELLRQEELAGDRLAILHGGIAADEREQLRVAFQTDPAEHPVRILLATDAASEGIDLQNHCHRLVNYDIPFNPNKLEQRIGRIDRWGQKRNPDVRHFVGTGWDRAVDSFEADLEFLSRVAKKVAQMEDDLGSVNAVLADAVQRRMLGDIPDYDVERAARETREARRTVQAETNVGEQVRRLRANLDDTVRELGITPSGVKRVVDTALALARQQPLRPHLDQKHLAEGLYDVPPLTGSWERATADLAAKLRKSGEPPRQRPVTFDAAATLDPEGRVRDDVVLAHLGHPLVAMSTRLLRAAVSNPEIGLHRVAAVVSDDPALETTLVGAFFRFVLVGGDGVRLHEEVLHAGGWVPETGRFRRLENLTALGGILGRALAQGTSASAPVRHRLAALWPRIGDAVVQSIDWRVDGKEQKRHQLERKLAQRMEAEQTRVVANLDQFGAALRAKLAENEEDDALFSRIEATRSREELDQYRKDRRSWEERLSRLAEERDRELDAIAARYRDPRPHRFPVAVVFVVPKREATR
ncbi:superfamily II DNA or RNA helicase [Streptosporangium becharense]|uniref:Superfamily II DNA or RNA helicase n=1 Tax=Streptosporangium becharense TaxID=1816182 RepID=A0A7W9IKA5_9ACTN|nr:DISARM system SNF2-like helicase DrmD [Streptosporangium becharense]MBB2911279.1 superfamily II DNA or RNA helicase [Streptosporangium becharense]MBB5821663.1 superfamily II DNA or RNA helicase [Streptosporangium becharense]